MAASAPLPGYYVWEVPGKWISIELSLDLVDRLQQDVIRGFGALPRRGAEVGGILLGTVSGGGRIVRVEDYEEVPIEYRRGPSYLLSKADAVSFDASLAKLRNQGANSWRPIGYFRSHTRETVALDPEDLDLVTRSFPDPETIILVIRPFGTKPSIAGFYFKEDGKFQDGPPLMEFPFRRRDLAPEDMAVPPERPPRRTPRAHLDREAAPIPQPDPLPAPFAERPPAPPSQPDAAEDQGAAAEVIVAPLVTTAHSPRRSGGIWVPLSIVFLLGGILFGFQLAMTMGSRALGGSDPYHVSLSAVPSGNDVEVKWDRQSSAVRKAQKGILSIEDGVYRKSIDLDPERLQGNSEVIYRPSSNHVLFRLELILKGANSVAETVDWKK